MRRLDTENRTLGVRTVVTLIVLALLLPQALERTRAQSAGDTTDVTASAALGYARLRLWADFLEQRAERFPDHELPPPSLTEYRRYLRILGLRRRGDAAMLIVIPALDDMRHVDRLRVELDSPHEPIRLTVFLEPTGERLRRAGSLTIGTTADGSLQCNVEDVPQARIWSLWPVHPRPLLP
jgi:hypothetical protein